MLLVSVRADTAAAIRLQICHEFERFSAYMQKVKVGNFFGGFPIKQHKKTLKEDCPNIIVGTPGRLKQACTPLLSRCLAAICSGSECNTLCDADTVRACITALRPKSLCPVPARASASS